MHKAITPLPIKILWHLMENLVNPVMGRAPSLTNKVCKLYVIKQKNSII
jgi:hypothetical protein